MKMKLVSCLLFSSACLAFVLSVTTGARPGNRLHWVEQDHRNAAQRSNLKTATVLIGVISLPGNPLVSSDIAWVDPGTKKFYLSDRSNFGIDIIDAESDLFVGRVTGFVGPIGLNGRGPNGLLVTPDKKAWAGDGNATVRVADVNPNSPAYLHILKSISVAIPECGPNCNRADEIGYDPADDKILVAIDQPNSAANPTTPIAPYAALIGASSYQISQIIRVPNSVPGGGLEQPLWDPKIRRFFLTVPSVSVKDGKGEIAVINPDDGIIEKTYSPGNCSPSGEVLTPSQRLVVECRGSVVILNALNGEVIATVPNVDADELWYNQGDGRVYAAVDDSGKLQVVDVENGTLLQTLTDPGAFNEAAFAENNRIFTPVRVTASEVATPRLDQTTCSLFGFRGTGCIAVFAHAGSDSNGR